jgi:hypothetical protein
VEQTSNSISPAVNANPNPTLFEPRKASEPYSRGQWDSALKATPRSPKGDVSYVGALEPAAVLGCPRLPVSPSSLTAHGAQLLSDYGLIEIGALHFTFFRKKILLSA